VAIVPMVIWKFQISRSSITFHFISQ
jgi:hypothetical protein